MTTAARPGHAPVRNTPNRMQPFDTTEEVWFWTMAALIARRDGARIVSGAGLVQRPCEPDDVVKALDRLYRQRRIDLQHARILRIWGERQAAPDPRYASEKGDWRLWREAISRLDWPLRVKGIVAGPLPVAQPAEVLAFPGHRP
ncbi:hypothetical protein [Siccirubricoccus phaeus]|uniref:hypothetical protein n=1 Tax=Siccirubricoccus phaeus TaxID=2595053 RepID=UPI0011F3B260|nr:hypothetical protein [Siccirubricoccus phaeus]